MHQSILAKRKATATQRIITTATRLAAFLELDPKFADALQPKGIKDPDVVDMMRLEAVADVLDQVGANAGLTEPVTTQADKDTITMSGGTSSFSFHLAEPSAELEGEPGVSTETAPENVQDAAQDVEELQEEPAPKNRKRSTRKSTKK